jgi:hypothetical protein
MIAKGYYNDGAFYEMDLDVENTHQVVDNEDSLVVKRADGKELWLMKDGLQVLVIGDDVEEDE